MPSMKLVGVPFHLGCIEVANHGGQGDGVVDIAACRSCSMAPKARFESFNAFLDLQLFLDFASEMNVGFFS